MKRSECGIYKITSPSGSIYIGQTFDYARRIKNYKYGHSKAQPRLHNSLIKYGVQNHKFELIHPCKKNKLNSLEIHYIKYYDCFNTPHGLNLRSGGMRYTSISDETRKKMSESAKGKVISKATRKKISETSKGRLWSDEHRNKYILARKGCKVSDETRKLISKNTRIALKCPFIRKKIADASRARIVSEETRKKRSDALKGEKCYLYGKKLSKLTRRRMSRAKKGCTPWNKGKTNIYSEETLRRNREAHVGRKLSAEWKRKISKSLRKTHRLKKAI